MKQQYTIKGLSELTNIAAGTIRAWIMKPIDGQPYSSENVNYSNLVEKLNKYFEDFEERFGFKTSDIEIVKAERTTKKWLTLDELKKISPLQLLVMHNYSLKTELAFVRHIEDLDVYLFNTKDGKLKAYTGEQLETENIKVEVKE